MTLVIQILGIISLISIILLAYVGISTLSQLKKTIENSEPKIDKLINEIGKIADKTSVTLDTVNEFKGNLSETLKNIDVLTIKLKGSVDNFDTMSEQITHSIISIQKTGSKFIDLIEPIESVIEQTLSKFVPTINATTKIFSAVSKGFGAFSNRIKK
jgi:gas vesicle protein